MRRLARALYPATLAEPATLAATATALERGGLSEGMRLVLQEQEAILRAALAARSTPRRLVLSLLLGSATRPGRRRRRGRRRSRA